MERTSWWDRLPEEEKEKYRAQAKSDYDAHMLAFKAKHANLKFGTDVTGIERNVKADPPPSGFVDEPDVYDDHAYSRPVDPPKVIIAINRDNEFVTGVAMIETTEEEDID